MWGNNLQFRNGNFRWTCMQVLGWLLYLTWWVLIELRGGIRNCMQLFPCRYVTLIIILLPCVINTVVLRIQFLWILCLSLILYSYQCACTWLTVNWMSFRRMLHTILWWPHFTSRLLRLNISCVFELHSHCQCRTHIAPSLIIIVRSTWVEHGSYIYIYIYLINI